MMTQQPKQTPYLRQIYEVIGAVMHHNNSPEFTIRGLSDLFVIGVSPRAINRAISELFRVEAIKAIRGWQTDDGIEIKYAVVDMDRVKSLGKSILEQLLVSGTGIPTN